MARINYAAIDIGSNAARLLIKSIDREANDKDKFKKLLLLRVPCDWVSTFSRMANSLTRRPKICVGSMKAYRQMMKLYDVADYRACATSAMRDATNGPDIIRRVLKETGINIEIINGKEEARIVYSNHIECMADREGAYIYVDVGGGSTEVNFLTDGKLQSSASYNIGTVRSLTGKVRDDEWLRLEEDMGRIAERAGRINIIGSGGNINKLYRMAQVKDKEQQRLPINSLEQVYDRLKPLSVEERIEQFGLKDDRADVIIPAAEIFLRIARIVHADYVWVPVIGLADGIIDDLYEQRETRTPQKLN